MFRLVIIQPVVWIGIHVFARILGDEDDILEVVYQVVGNLQRLGDGRENVRGSRKGSCLDNWGCRISGIPFYSRFDMENDTIYGVPVDTWYSLMVAARADKECGGSSDGPLWDLLDEIFGIDWRIG